MNGYDVYNIIVLIIKDYRRGLLTEEECETFIQKIQDGYHVWNLYEEKLNKLKEEK